MRTQEMAINSYDIVSTLQALGMMKYWKGKHIILKKQVSSTVFGWVFGVCKTRVFLTAIALWPRGVMIVNFRGELAIGTAYGKRVLPPCGVVSACMCVCIKYISRQCFRCIYRMQ